LFNPQCSSSACLSPPSTWAAAPFYPAYLIPLSRPVTPFCAFAIASSVDFLVAALISSCFFYASDLILLISLSAF
tara:strand:+ start:75 stop:299 length:225 start_codon:yes stop_codon:yes gene_type:complete